MIVQNSSNILELHHPDIIYHVFPIKESLVNEGKVHEEFLFNRNEYTDDDIFNYLKKYNDLGYNIYKTFNTFASDRRDTLNVYEYRGVLIDLDYSQGVKEDYISVLSHCNLIKQKYGIFPIEINETYKGYHLIYGLSDELMFIDTNIYLELSKLLVGEFNADYNAKQVTGLYKVFGFIDHKEDAQKKGRNFKIINKYIHPKSRFFEVVIKEEHLQRFNLMVGLAKDHLRKELLGRKIYWNKMFHGIGTNEKADTFFQKYINKVRQKDLKKKRYDLLINSIDAKTWIEAINDAHEKGRYGFNREIIIRKDEISIDDTSGLKLYLDLNERDCKYEVKDFSKGTRYGNKNFIFNHYFKIQTKNAKQKKAIILQYLDFISTYFGIKPTVGLKKISVNSKVIYDYIKGNIIIDNEGIKNDELLKKARSIKIDTDGNIQDDWFRIYFLINLYIQKNGKRTNFDGEYEIDYDDFLLYNGFNFEDPKLKKYISEIIRYINYLNVRNNNSKNSQLINIAKLNIQDNTLYVTFNKFEIKNGKNIKIKVIYINENFGKFAKKKTDTRKTLFALRILYGLFNFKGLKIKVKGVNRELNYSVGNLYRLFTDMVRNNLVEDFKIKGNYAYLGTKKYLKSLNQEKEKPIV